MKAAFEDISRKKGTDSFLAYAFEVPEFSFKWHYHPEYELTLITEGVGKRLVGDSNEYFEAGDLVLLGPQLPHTWSSDTSRSQRSSAVVIQFHEDFIRNFSRLNEFSAIDKLLTSASRGLFFPDSSPVSDLVQQLPNLEGIVRITALLDTLHKLTYEEPVQLTSSYFSAAKREETEKRINRVCLHIQTDFSKELPLQQAAEMVHLSPSAFCKFFKRTMGQTYSDYVNEIRIGKACQLLVESDRSIHEIAYDTGFESLTYFNRVFLRKKGVTPRGFRANSLSAQGRSV